LRNENSPVYGRGRTTRQPGKSVARARRRYPDIGDYNRIHSEYISQNKTHAGIILAPQQRYGVGEQLRRLLRIINSRTAEQMQNNVEFLSAWG
jgi:hypothetical protein